MPRHKGLTTEQLAHQLDVRLSWVNQRVPGVTDGVVTDEQLNALVGELRFNKGFTWLPINLYDKTYRFVAPPEGCVIVGVSSPVLSQLRRMRVLPYISLPTATGKATVPRYPTSYLTALCSHVQGAAWGTRLATAQAYANQCKESERIM